MRVPVLHLRYDVSLEQEESELDIVVGNRTLKLLDGVGARASPAPRREDVGVRALQSADDEQTESDESADGGAARLRRHSGRALPMRGPHASALGGKNSSGEARLQ